MNKRAITFALLSAVLLACLWIGSPPLRKALAAEEKAEIIERWELIPPEGYKLYGGADIESRVDREGTIFVAATGKTDRGFGGVMWMQRKDGSGGWKSTPIDLGELYPGGRGSLSVEADGRLYLTQWNEKEKAWRLRIPQWKS